MTTLKQRDAPLVIPKWLVVSILSLAAAVIGGFSKDYVVPASGSLTPEQIAEVRTVVEKESPYMRDRGELREMLKEQAATLKELLDRTARIEGMMGRERTRSR